MSLGVCIPDLIRQEKIPAERAQRVREWYDRRLAQLEDGLSRPAAEAQATKDTLDWLRADVLHRQRTAALQARKQGEWRAEIRREAGDGVPSITAIRDRMLAIFRHGEVITGRLMKTQDEFLARYRKNLLNFNMNRAELDDIGRALIDRAGGDDAAGVMARAMAETMETARQMYNAAGGRIGKLTDRLGYLPQEHDWRALKAKGFEAWRAHPAIDAARVVHPETGVEAVGLAREDVLRRIFETIEDEGARGMTLGQQGQRSMANRRADARVLHFSSYDDWITYHREFGVSDNIYDIFTQHISGMARDIALMERMGPNPAATLRFVQDSYEQMVKQRGSIKERGKIPRRRGSLERVYGELSGKHLHPADEGIAQASAAVRALVTASHLGTAMVSAIADVGTTMRTAQFNRVPMMRFIWRYVSDIARGSDASKEALRRGLYVQDFIGHTSAMARYTGEEMTHEKTRVLADAVIRGTFLARHTRKMGWAWGREHQAMLTRNAGTSWTDLNPQIRKQMERYEIGETDWDAYRATPISSDAGIDDIMPFDVTDRATGDKFQAMILGETDHAIFTKSHRVLSAVNGRLERGDPVDEAARMAFALKNFPLGIVAVHGKRMMEQPGFTGKAGYAVPLFLYMTGLGALAVQLYNIATGRDPEPMDTPEFWMKAVVRGGGASVLGDLVGDPRIRDRDAFVSYLAGPVYAGIGQGAVVTRKNVEAGLAGEDTSFAADYYKLGKQWTPGQNMWWHRLVTDRLLFSAIERELDPNADEKYDRMLQRASDEGTAYFWEPGQQMPERAPELSNAIPE